MHQSGNNFTDKELGKSYSSKKKDGAKQRSPLHMITDINESELKTHKSDMSSSTLKKKVNSIRKGKRNDSASKKVIQKATLCKTKSSKKRSSSSGQVEKQPPVSSKENGKIDNGHVRSRKLKAKGKRKGQKGNLELDETSRLQRRTRYLLIKMKLEQNLIDAYSMEGWKGQSREKIRPEKELQRARKQIFKCKLGLRDAIRQLDLLSSVGSSIEEAAIAADGSVHHENIICAKCKLREAFPDNDIILCDGSCNCAFHQKCLDPPLLTENIPPEDQGWFCKFCDCKMELVDVMNAHLGTHFSVDTNWQEIFKEEAALSDSGVDLLNQEQEWPSDDSEDDDYDPEKVENNGSYIRDGSEDDDGSDDCCSSGSLWSLEAEVFSECERSAKRSKCSQNTSLELTTGVVDSDDATDGEIISGRRRRRAVDYRKLYDEMFGKDAHANEQISEDEDWGPAKRKRREKESDAATTLMTLCEREKIRPNVDTTDLKTKPQSEQTKRPIFRLPPNAVEKLRLVFAENELPARTVRQDLSKQLGIEYEKVNKWFKNARYLALKERKAGTEFGDDVSLKLLKENVKKEKKKVNFRTGAGEREAENELERLCKVKDKVEKLQKVIMGIPNRKSNKAEALHTSAQKSIIYVPVAELKEKRLI